MKESQARTQTFNRWVFALKKLEMKKKSIIYSEWRNKMWRNNE